MKKRSKKTWLCAPLYLWCILFVGLPLVYVAGVSFCTRDATWGITAVFTLENYRMIVDPMYLRVFTESLLLSAVCTVIALLIGYPFAYAMVKATPARQALLMMLVIVPFWTSALIRANGWMLILRRTGRSTARSRRWRDSKAAQAALYARGRHARLCLYDCCRLPSCPAIRRLHGWTFRLSPPRADLGARPLRVFFAITLPLTMGGVMSAVNADADPKPGHLLPFRPARRRQNGAHRQSHSKPTAYGPQYALWRGAFGCVAAFDGAGEWVQRKMGGETRIL